MLSIAAFQLSLSLHIDLSPVDTAGFLLTIESQESLVGLRHINLDVVEEIMKVLMVDTRIEGEWMTMAVINICLLNINEIRFEVDCIGNMEMCTDEIVSKTSIKVRMTCELQVVKIAEETYGTRYTS